MLTVAIASENDVYDGAVLERLLACLLATEVARWKTQMRIVGHAKVVGLAEPFLRRAAEEGIRHALLAVDNDGGARRGPQHESDHDRARQAADRDGCRGCRVLQAIPQWWRAEDRRYCAVVPVQAIETWLLWIRGDAFDSEPEKAYDRWLLKKRFFGKPLPPESMRARLALEQVGTPGALEKLRQLRSFRWFEEQLGTWR